METGAGAGKLAELEPEDPAGLLRAELEAVDLAGLLLALMATWRTTLLVPLFCAALVATIRENADEQQRQQFEREMNERVAIRNSITNGAASLSPIPNDFGTTQTNKPITLKAPPPPHIDGAKPILSKEPPKLDGESSLPLPPIMS